MEVVVGLKRKVNAPVTGAGGHVPTLIDTHLWHNRVRYHAWEDDQRRSEQYQCPPTYAFANWRAPEASYYVS